MISIVQAMGVLPLRTLCTLQNTKVQMGACVLTKSFAALPRRDGTRVILCLPEVVLQGGHVTAHAAAKVEGLHLCRCEGCQRCCASVEALHLNHPPGLGTCKLWGRFRLHALHCHRIRVSLN